MRRVRVTGYIILDYTVLPYYYSNFYSFTENSIRFNTPVAIIVIIIVFL